MIDKLKLSLFLKPEFLTEISGGRAFLNYEQLGLWGFNVYAGSVHYDEIFPLGKRTVIRSFSREQCPWDRIESSYSGLAVKWWDSNGIASEPRLEIKGSPAKLMQGHNVFGSTNIKECALFMMQLVRDAYPELVEAINWTRTTMDLIDVTYSAVLDSRYHSSFMGFLRNVSNGQMRKSSFSFESTCYWGKSANGKSSKRKVLKVYLKHPEMKNDIENLKRQFEKNPYDENIKDRLAIMTNEKLQDYAKSLVRFEATLKKDWFKGEVKAKRLPVQLGKFYLKDWIKYQEETEKKGECLILNLWLASFDTLFDALNGEAINMQSEHEVLEKLKSVYFKETKKGLTFAKANRIFDLYMRFVNEGYDKVYETYKDNRATFGRNLNDLIDATGINKAQLQNLHQARDNNVIPFCQLINVDFGHQIPDFANELQKVSGSDLNMSDFTKTDLKEVRQMKIIKAAIGDYELGY